MFINGENIFAKKKMAKISNLVNFRPMRFVERENHKYVSRFCALRSAGRTAPAPEYMHQKCGEQVNSIGKRSENMRDQE